MGAFLQTWGVVPDPEGVHEPVDHIVVELEFLAIVCAGELAAHGETAAHGDARTCDPALEEIEQRFLREHLGQWGQLLAYDIRTASEEPMYLAAAEMLERMLGEKT